MDWNGALFNPSFRVQTTGIFGTTPRVRIWGSLRFISAMTTGALLDWSNLHFMATLPGKTITMAGQIWYGNVYFDGSGT